MALYIGGWLLSLFDELWMKRFLHCFNLIYKISLHTTFIGPLLDQAYDKIKYNTSVVVNNSSYLNFITNRSSNINYE